MFLHFSKDALKKKNIVFKTKLVIAATIIRFFFFHLLFCRFILSIPLCDLFRMWKIMLRLSLFSLSMLIQFFFLCFLSIYHWYLLEMIFLQPLLLLLFVFHFFRECLSIVVWFHCACSDSEFQNLIRKKNVVYMRLIVLLLWRKQKTTTKNRNQTNNWNCSKYQLPEMMNLYLHITIYSTLK